MIRFGLYGLLFGFILARVDATDYDAMVGMFLFEDLHLMGVIGTAIVVSGLGLLLMRRRAAALKPTNPTAAQYLTTKPKPVKPGNIVGGLIFGVGWALTGTCPGTALSQLGEGKLVALFTVAGIFVGTGLYRRFGASVESWLRARRRTATAAATAIVTKANR